MSPQEFGAFHELWLLAHAKSSSNQVPADAVVMAVFDDLAGYPLAAVEAALRHHARVSRFAPTVHDVVAVLAFAHPRVSADEAWALMPRSEEETVCWTEEMAAAFAVCAPLLELGDRYNAGRAFKAAYVRECEQAELAHKPVRWQVTLGYDKAQVEPVLQAAVALGRISAARAAALLPGPMDGGVLGGLLTGKVAVAEVADPQLRERWRAISALLA
ncbi:hypothetical protein KFZ76_20240 [Methylovulum psychrotolerans]|uniref:hypothetical protein n=1 Tax=Methylovulum psychrotolerans TaxID=1704499 RepID=UPI001BFF94D0|nr:hypothetical protein [Methylovulum psychrotolerans]MBT9100035.1 hypothetical protein [Methylovulum psychrotolerans]